MRDNGSWLIAVRAKPARRSFAPWPPHRLNRGITNPAGLLRIYSTAKALLLSNHLHPRRPAADQQFRFIRPGDSQTKRHRRIMRCPRVRSPMTHLKLETLPVRLQVKERFRDSGRRSRCFAFLTPDEIKQNRAGQSAVFVCDRQRNGWKTVLLPPPHAGKG